MPALVSILAYLVMVYIFRSCPTMSISNSLYYGGIAFLIM